MSRTWGDSRMFAIAAGVRTWLQKTEKLARPARSASRIAMAVGGVVVSNPIAKNTTSRAGFSRAMRTASAAEYTMRMSAPAAFAFVRLERSEAGTRIVSA